MKVCIVIPLYKENLNPLEIISLKRLFEVDKHHQKFFITFKELNLGFYRSYLNDFQNWDIKFFRKDYFTSLETYSKLLIETSFYNEFIEFNYMLIYQLDALILKDELDDWCKKSYDYIGAPWFDYEKKYAYYQKLRNSSSPMIKWLKEKIDFNQGNYLLVGNGGFSLRRVKTFRKISKWLLFIEPNLLRYKINEDIIWSIFVPKYFKGFKIPEYDEALHFAVETSPNYALKLLQNDLPFGCHGWDKNYEFWKETLRRKNISI
jgi:hypothetical protein